MRALLLASLLAAPAAATQPLAAPAPEFPAGAEWINAKPLSMAALKGRKAVLVAFLNPAQLRSLRVLPVLKGWFDRYALSQFMVIAAVTPDLEAQKDPAWIRAEVKRLGIEFPVVADVDRRLWEAYANEGWPGMYLIDSRGMQVFERLGEGDYAEFEAEIRKTLDPLTSGLPDPLEPPDPPTADCGRATPDIAMGERAKAAPLSLDRGQRKHGVEVAAREGDLATRGKWRVSPDGLLLDQPNVRQEAYVRVVYQGAQAMAVLAPPPGAKERFFVKQDDQWLYEGIAGQDVRYDDDGRSYVEAASARLYDLTRDPGVKPRRLAVIHEGKGGGIHGFSFADRCLAAKLP